MKKKVTMKQRIKLLTLENESLADEKVFLEAEIAAYKKMPIFDNQRLSELLQVLYAAKGGMASWGRRS